MIFNFLSNLDCDKAEDINGVVNPEDEKPDVDNFDKMDEGLLSGSGWFCVLFCAFHFHVYIFCERKCH
jgi:hypothetical protein